MKDLADSRFSWIGVLTALRSVLAQAETAEKANLVTPDNGGVNTDAGIWVENFTPVLPNGSAFAAGEEAGGGGGGMGRTGRPGFGRGGGRYRAGGGGRPMAVMPTEAPTAAANAGEIGDISLLCRGVNRSSLSATANTDLAFLVKRGMTNNPAFKEANLVGNLKVDDANSNTFTFSLLIKLTHPVKL
jgi:hypothetical protein